VVSPYHHSPVISKLFEMVILDMCDDALQTDSLQFGFKNKIGTADAIFTVKSTIKYFIDRGSSVYVSSLYIGCILYADDILLLCPSVTGLQDMLDRCSETAKYLSLEFNVELEKDAQGKSCPVQSIGLK